MFTLKSAVSRPLSHAPSTQSYRSMARVGTALKVSEPQSGSGGAADSPRRRGAHAASRPICDATRLCCIVVPLRACRASRVNLVGKRRGMFIICKRVTTSCTRAFRLQPPRLLWPFTARADHRRTHTRCESALGREATATQTYAAALSVDAACPGRAARSPVRHRAFTQRGPRPRSAVGRTVALTRSRGWSARSGAPRPSPHASPAAPSGAAPPASDSRPPPIWPSPDATSSRRGGGACAAAQRA